MADSINFTLKDASNESFPFTSLRNLKTFLSSEIDFWNEQRDRFSSVQGLAFLGGGQALTPFYQAICDLYIKRGDFDLDELNNKVSSIFQSHLRNRNQNWLSKTHAYIGAYINCIELFGSDGANAFYAYATGKSISNLQQKNVLSGAFAAYEFFDAPDEHIKRKSSEKISLSALRNEFKRAQDGLFSDVESMKSEIKDWSHRAKKKQVRRYRAQKVLSQKLYERNEQQFAEQKDWWEKEFQNLRQVYEDQLKLEGPAKYWLKAAKKFKVQGTIAALVLVLLVTIGLISITSILELWMLKGETPLSLSSVQGIILFGSLAAVFAFGVRVLSRLTFSSFHLMRDAEERHQLTHLYLSLINETESDERAREIILQALFSRSETGLLGTENGPTMPGIRDIANGMGRSNN